MKNPRSPPQQQQQQEEQKSGVAHWAFVKAKNEEINLFPVFNTLPEFSEFTL